VRYLVHAPTKGVPYLGSVLTPRMTRTYAGWSSRGEIYGQPGTQAIGINGPEGMHSGINDLATTGTSRSIDAPNVIYPPLYWEASKVKEHAPVARISDNQMPVPAKRAPNVLVSSPYLARQGGQRQVYQPQVVQSWRGMKGTANG
jgi:hypothetical protein